MTTPTFTAPPTPTPNKNQSQSEFNAAITAELAYKATFATDANTLIGWIVDQAAAVVSYVASALAYKTGAEAAQAATQALRDEVAATEAGFAATATAANTLVAATAGAVPFADVDGVAIGEGDAIISGENYRVYYARSARSALQNVVDPALDPENFTAQVFSDIPAVVGEIAGTIIDTIIYDTSQDSDGGLWRNLTDFPSVVGIVLEASTLTIYDAAEPEFPVWSVKDFTGFTIRSVAALNGVVIVGTTAGVVVLDFASDDTEVALTYTTGTTPAIVNNAVNCVTITALDGAPIDMTTGLPVPTVAAGTAGGVSVVKSDDTVVDSGSTAAVSAIGFSIDGLWWDHNSSGKSMNYASFDEIEQGGGFGALVAANTVTASTFATLAYGGGFVFSDDILIKVGHLTGGTAKQGVMLHSPDYDDFSEGGSALITSTYATGWMRGDIQGAFLCSTDATSLVGGTDDDRSIKGNDLPISGTTTRAAVASGADLVWYTFGADCSVTLDADISASGSVTWWQDVGGVPTRYVKDLSGGDSYVNGDAGTPPTDAITFAGAVMTFKAGKTMALARPSGSIPTATQVASDHADEEPSFRAGAQSTLYGTSDAVTALARDALQGSVHVGTSDGRSILKGLQRMDNTTDAVTTTIAANDRLVLEQ